MWHYGDQLIVGISSNIVSKVSGGPYCNRNVNSGAKTYAVNLIFYMVTCDNFNIQEFSASLLQMTNNLLQMIDSCGLHTIQWYQMPTDDATTRSI